MTGSKRIVFATNNQHKFEEISSKVIGNLQLVKLSDIGFEEEIPEDQDTIEGNAIQKAQYIFDRYNIPCFADDTGLEVDALNGAPGVYSARYAGENPTYEDNVNKLLKNMSGKTERTARFHTCIAFIQNRKIELFNGSIEGVIIEEATGAGGFGYDPVFLPNGYSQTFAEMELSEKNKISHRAIATQKLLDYLNRKYQ